MDLRSAITLVEQSDLTFKIEVDDYHSRQMDCTLSALLGGKQVGKLNFAVFQDQPSIQMIRVDPEFARQGIGTAMVKKLQQAFPETEINWGTMTSDGAALRKSLKTNVKTDPEVAAKLERLKALKAKEEAFQVRWGELERDPDDQAVQDLVAKWNDLNDAIYALERELEGVKTSTTLISESADHLPATPENIERAKQFVTQKWIERAKERGYPDHELPTDLSSSCKFTSQFAQRVFGGELRGNWHHQYVKLSDGRMLDLNIDAADVQKLGTLAHSHDRKFWRNPEHRESMDSCRARVDDWVREFLGQ